MNKNFESLNSDQRKYLSGLCAVGCISWASPLFSFLTKLYEHEVVFSQEYMLFLLSCLIISIISLTSGFIILNGENK